MAPNSSSAYPCPARCGTDVSTSKKAISGPPAPGSAAGAAPDMPSAAAAARGSDAGVEVDGIAIGTAAGG
uniref:Uncharacterized protein n=1 Tax=Arundo donax TaxID=35708 RepID=A0A0A9CQS3_ARUDO